MKIQGRLRVVGHERSEYDGRVSHVIHARVDQKSAPLKLYLPDGAERDLETASGSPFLGYRDQPEVFDEYDAVAELQIGVKNVPKPKGGTQPSPSLRILRIKVDDGATSTRKAA